MYPLPEHRLELASPSTRLEADAYPATTTLNISTTAATTASLRRSEAPRSRGLLALGMLLAGAAPSKRTKGAIGRVGGLLLLLMLIGSCGGGNQTTSRSQPGTPAGTYTVTASAQAVQKVMTVTLTVQ